MKNSQLSHLKRLEELNDKLMGYGLEAEITRLRKRINVIKMEHEHRAFIIIQLEEELRKKEMKRLGEIQTELFSNAVHQSNPSNK